MMSHDDTTDQQRDKLLLRLLKTPPQPRPKRARDKDKPVREEAHPKNKEQDRSRRK